MKRFESGNVIFYVLIAVGLLAALSYTVAQSIRGNVSSITTQRAGLYAAEIIEYGNVMSRAVAQTRLRGYLDTEISFENSVVSGYANASCLESECEIFDLAGGGVHYMVPKDDWLDSAHSGQLRYGELYFHAESSAIDVGESDDDLIMFIPYLKKELCEAINAKLDLSPVTDDVPVETDGPFAVNIKFTGSYVSAFDRKVSGDGTTGETEILYGKMAGCTEASGTASVPASGTYHYYQVLIAR